MGKLRATITHPTTREDGTPLPLTEIKHVVLETKLLAASTWTAVGSPMLPAELSRVIDNVPGGTWQLRATWVDTGGRACRTPVVAQIDMPTALPNAGTLDVVVV